MTGNPHIGVVVDLVDPYLTPEAKNIGGFKSLTSEGGNYAVWWLRRHPGRWALVAEGTTGLTRQLLKVCPDIEVREKTKHNLRTYACVPHPEGESLAAALERRAPDPGLTLPRVTRDQFDWTPEELAEACQVARANLFPTGA